MQSTWLGLCPNSVAIEHALGGTRRIIANIRPLVSRYCVSSYLLPILRVKKIGTKLRHYLRYIFERIPTHTTYSIILQFRLGPVVFPLRHTAITCVSKVTGRCCWQWKGRRSRGSCRTWTVFRVLSGWHARRRRSKRCSNKQRGQYVDHIVSWRSVWQVFVRCLADKFLHGLYVAFGVSMRRSNLVR